MFFLPELSRPPGQLHPGQPAVDAGAHRARMVFLAVLRDPARVHLGLHPARPSCGACSRCSARSCCCSSCPGSTGRRSARTITGRSAGSSSGSLVVDVLVLGYCGGSPATNSLRDAQPDLRGLLLPALPGHPADRSRGSSARAAAELDHRGGAGRAWRDQPVAKPRWRTDASYRGYTRHGSRYRFPGRLGLRGGARLGAVLDGVRAGSPIRPRRPPRTSSTSIRARPSCARTACSASSTSSSSSAASRSTRKSARPATRCGSSRSATSKGSATTKAK